MTGTNQTAGPALAVVQPHGMRLHAECRCFDRRLTTDALFFGGRPGHATGHEAIRAYFASYDGVIQSATLELVEQQFIRFGDDCFLAQGYGEFAFVLGDGTTSRSRLRTTLVIVAQQHEWKIRQHHFSASPETPPI